jgi:hypothetical protein
MAATRNLGSVFAVMTIVNSQLDAEMWNFVPVRHSINILLQILSLNRHGDGFKFMG